MHLPLLQIILVFGLRINITGRYLLRGGALIPGGDQMESIQEPLHIITAESSFQVGALFFILFGYSISLSLINNRKVIMVGCMIVLALFLVRLYYLRFSFHTKVFPEVLFIPRGLITIVLFYKIPTSLKLVTFNDGILFFVILFTGIILSLGMVLYK